MLTDALRTVLVVRHNGLGDLLTALPAMRGIRRTFPGHEIATTCPASLVPLARELDFADTFISEPMSTLLDPSEHERLDDSIVAAVLAKRTFTEVAVALRVPVRRDIMCGLIALRPLFMCAFRHPDVQESASFPEFRFDDHILRRWERLLHPCGIATNHADLHTSIDTEPQPDLVFVTVVHVGAGSGARRWTTERWAAVSRELEAAGHRVFLTGSTAEIALAEQVRSRADLAPERNLCGHTDIVTLAAIVRASRLVLSTDTGIAHLATTFCTPSVTLFGAVPPAWWGPPAGYPLNRALWKGQMGEPYATEPDRGLLKISVDEVLDAAADLEGSAPLMETTRRAR